MVDDLNLKIAVNKEHKFWEDLNNRCEESISNDKRDIKIQRAVMRLAQKEIKKQMEMNK